MLVNGHRYAIPTERYEQNVGTELHSALGYVVSVKIVSLS